MVDSKVIPELRTQQDVDNEVVRRLSDTSDPHNVFQYDLAAKRPIKEKLRVIVKGLAIVIIGGIILAIGKAIDASVFGIHGSSGHGGFLSLTVIIVLLAIFVVGMVVNRIRSSW